MYSPANRLVEMLESFRLRKAMYIHPITGEQAERLLQGMRMASCTFGLDVTPEIWMEVSRRRGWESGAKGVLPHMRRSGLSEERIIDGLIDIEIECYRAASSVRPGREG